MEIIIYLSIFIIGTLLGSFFSLAIYRIPLKQDITHERSYCPKCNHKLGFWDMIPILSYICLKGKCRYCKEKIRSRYILLEIFSGILFLLFALSLKIDIYNINIQKLVYFLFGIIYIATLFIIGGIEKEKKFISKTVLIFGLIIEAIYIIYLYILNINIYKYIMYLLITFISVILFEKEYLIQILNLCLYLSIGTSEKIVIFTIAFTLLNLIIKNILDSINKRKSMMSNEKNKGIPIGFYLCFSNILVLIIYNFLN